MWGDSSTQVSLNVRPVLHMEGLSFVSFAASQGAWGGGWDIARFSQIKYHSAVLPVRNMSATSEENSKGCTSQRNTSREMLH